MPLVVNVHEAKTQLSALLARAERGELVVIARAGRPVAQLVPIDGAAGRRFGIMDFEVPASFFEPLDDDELARWA